MSIVWSSQFVLEKDADPFDFSQERGFMTGPAKPSNTSLETIPAPSRILVRSSVHGTLTMDNLRESTTVGSLKKLIAERLMLPPTRLIHLESWGSELSDHLSLQECKLKTNSMLNMRISLGVSCLSGESLDRVRVSSTALETQRFVVGSSITGLELKQKIQEHLSRGTYEWYNKMVSVRQ